MFYHKTNFLSGSSSKWNPISSKQTEKLDTILFSLPHMLTYTLGAAVAIGGIGASYVTGRYIGPPSQFIGVSTVGAVSSIAHMAFNERKKKAAATELQNKFAMIDDLTVIDSVIIEDVSKKFGIDVKSELNKELRSIYHAYLSNIFTIDKQIKENQIEQIKTFKSSLGISDENLAQVHVDLGRHLNRLKKEDHNIKSGAEVSKAFQKLIYVTSRVIGDRKSSTLIQWKWSGWNISDAQVVKAKENFARNLFIEKLTTYKESEIPNDEINLADMYAYASEIGLETNVAIRLINQAIKTTINAKLSEAIRFGRHDCDHEFLIRNLEWVLAYDRRLVTISKTTGKLPLLYYAKMKNNIEEDLDRRELENIFRIFLIERTKNGELHIPVEDDIYKLCLIMGIEQQKSSEILKEVLRLTYRKILRQKYVSGELENTKSRGDMLNKLCFNLNFPLKEAQKINNTIFKQRLEQLIKKGSITNIECKELNKLRIMLSVKKESYSMLKKELCSQMFSKSIRQIFISGFYSFNEKDRKNIIKRKLKLRLDEDIGKEILEYETRKVLMQFISIFLDKRKHLESIKELKNMVMFYSYVMSHIIVPLSNYKNNNNNRLESVQTKTLDKKTKSKFSTTSNPLEGITNKNENSESQKDITISKDVDLKDRQDIYKTFFHYYITGDLIQPDSNSTTSLKLNEKEFLDLRMLGKILGLSHYEILSMHTRVKTQAFRIRAQQILTSEDITKEQLIQLKSVKNNSGLLDDDANKIIYSIQKNKTIERINKIKAHGKLSLDKIQEISRQGIYMDNIASKETRTKIFRCEVESAISNGMGDLDINKFLIAYPAYLQLEKKKTSQMLKEIVNEKIRPTLVQAISYYRQKKYSELTNVVNNLISMHRASPHSISSLISWDDKDEVKDLFAVYVRQCPSDAFAFEAASALGLSTSVVSDIKEITNSRNNVNEQSYFG